MVKNLPTMQETQVYSLGQEDLLEKRLATHSSILAWKIPWTENPGRLHSPRDGKESDITEQPSLSQRSEQTNMSKDKREFFFLSFTLILKGEKIMLHPFTSGQFREHP